MTSRASPPTPAPGLLHHPVVDVSNQFAALLGRPLGGAEPLDPGEHRVDHGRGHRGAGGVHRKGLDAVGAPGGEELQVGAEHLDRAEPAVQVLSKQVEEVSNGSVSNKAMMNAMSIGVAISVGLAMFRILTGLPILALLTRGAWRDR